MTFCSKCGKEVVDGTDFCPYCGNAVVQNNLADDASFGWNILGFFEPIIGLVLYLALKRNYPKISRRAGKGALIGAIVSGVLMSIYFSVLLIFLMGID